MKKNFLKTALILIMSASGLLAQVKWQESFATTQLPAGWLVIDADGSGAGLQLLTADSTLEGTAIAPQTGGAFWSSNLNNANRAGVIDEWLISPRISVIYAGDSLSFWAGANDIGFDDSIKVKISTTDNRRSSFTQELANFKVDGPAGQWTRYAFDLSDFDSSDIYFAINYYIKDGGPGGQHSDFVWIDNTTISGDAGTINNAPSLAQLLEPANESYIDVNSSVIDFRWSASQDLDVADTVRYTLSILNTFPQLHFTGLTDSSYSLPWPDLLNTNTPYAWTITASDGKSTVAAADTFAFIIALPNALDDQVTLPEDLVLYQNYPNPFNPQTTIKYELSQAGRVSLSVYNLLGQQVAALVDKEQAAGSYQLQWNAAGLPSGVYVYRLQTEQGYSQMKKMILLK